MHITQLLGTWKGRLQVHCNTPLYDVIGRTLKRWKACISKCLLPPWRCANHSAIWTYCLNLHRGKARCQQMFGSTSLRNIFHSYWKQLYFYITNACKWSYLLRSRMFGGRIFLVNFKCCRSVSKVRQWANKLKPSDDILSKHLQTFILLPQLGWKPLLQRHRHGSRVDSCFCSFKTSWP